MKRRNVKVGKTYSVFCATIIILTGLFVGATSAQTTTDENFHSTRIGISGGMGVNYNNAQDIVERVNGVVLQRVADFKSGVEFFGAMSVPVSRDWVVKGEYVYLLAGYSLASNVSLANAEFSYVIHMPTIVGQYILFESPTYNLKAGAGIGYHFGTYSEKYSYVEASFTSKGIGTLLELEGNTALGEDVFAHLGIQTRWDFIGDLKDKNGKSPIGNSATTSLQFFSIGARLGMTFYL